MKLSFIVPLYQAEKTIVACLESIFSQELDFTYEVIVIDNNSRDRGPELAKKYDIRFFHQKTQGRSATRNLGIWKAKGKWLAFIDADVVIDHHWASNMVGFFEAHQFVAGQGKIVPVGKQSILNDYRWWSSRLDTFGSFSITEIPAKEFPMINTAACLYRREILLSLGGFDESLPRHEDVDLSRRVFLSGGKIGSIQNAEALVYFHGEGWKSYIKRTLSDGFTRSLYYRKWNKDNLQHFPLPDHLRETFEQKRRGLPSRDFLNFDLGWMSYLFVRSPDAMWFLKYSLVKINKAALFCGKLFFLFETRAPASSFSWTRPGQVYRQLESGEFEEYLSDKR